MFATLARRMAEVSKEPVRRQAQTVFKTRKNWPPDFSSLSNQQQLRFEKKWKRRIAGASAIQRPGWIKGVKYAQLATITAALIWLFFFAEFEWWGRTYKPSEEMAKKAKYVFGILDPEKQHQWNKEPIVPGTPRETAEESQDRK